MNAHIIENGVVVNTIVVDSLDFMPGLVAATAGGIGWTFDGTNFTPPPAPEVTVLPSPTKEELMAELAALTAKINALE